jgi:hypothetical protein
MSLFVLAGAGRADPAVDEIASSCRGGSAGGGFGVRVWRDGSMLRWHAPAFFSDRDEIPMRDDPALAQRLFAELEALNFESAELSKKGDITCNLTRHVGGETHEASWAIGDAAAPAEIREFARRVRELVDDPEKTGAPQVREKE